MADITSPIELLELQNGESASFRVVGYEKGPLHITPRHQPAGKDVTAIRVHVPAEDKPAFPHYWDLTASTLVAQVEPWLQGAQGTQRRIKITAVGLGPKKRFQVETVPS